MSVLHESMTTANVQKPLFTYGLLKPGQIAHFQIEDFVSETNQAHLAPSQLWVRDGLPILRRDGLGNDTVQGSLLYFNQEQAERAYDRVESIEPTDSQYRWVTERVEVDDGRVEANVLAGNEPTEGAYRAETKEGYITEWDFAEHDPLFNEAVDAVRCILSVYEKVDEQSSTGGNFSDNDIMKLYILQMGYMQIWSCLERYCTLRYGFGKTVQDRITNLAKEDEHFREAVAEVVPDERRGVHIVSNENPRSREYLLPDDTECPDKRYESSIQYYYQVRNNIIHRGKGAVKNDYQILERSLEELIDIFRRMRDTAILQ